MLKDVYNDRNKMDAFLAQLTIGQLVELSLGQPVKVPGGTGGIGNIEEFGIPNVQTSDGPAGLRLSEPNTAWPCSTLVACTWDPVLVGKMGAAVAAEAMVNKVDIWLAPGMNIHRNPLNGRNFEYYSEDPLVTGKTAAAITRGAQQNGLAVTLKHFFANNREEDRKTTDSRISERAIREIYLKGFEIAVAEADPWCIMSSYNLVNGKGTSENGELLTNILRNEWNFKGVVMTDWGNQKNLALEVKAGNNVRMPSRDATHTTETKIIMNALDNGTIDRDILERNIKPVLEMIMKTGTFKRNILDAEVPSITKAELPKTGPLSAAGNSTGGNSKAIIFGGMAAVLLFWLIPAILLGLAEAKRIYGSTGKGKTAIFANSAEVTKLVFTGLIPVWNWLLLYKAYRREKGLFL